MISLVGMGQRYESLPVAALDAVDSAGVVIMQTLLSPCAQKLAERVGDVVSLDDLFEQAEDFDQLYDLGVERVLDAAKNGEACFCFLGSVAENGFVRGLKEREKIRCAALVDPAAEALFLARDLIPLTDQYACVDARSLEDMHLDTSRAVVVLGVDDAFTAAQTKLALTEYYAEDFEAVLVQGGEATSYRIGDLDQERDWGAGAALVLRGMTLEEKTRFTYPDLLKVMEILRAPGGCPWDAEQTHETLRPYLIEEAYEVSDAVADDDMNALYDELGDVLLQVVFHAEIARRAGEFTDVDVTTSECRKMIRRHPHVFGSVHVDSSDEVLVNWDQIKKEEKGEQAASALDGVPASMSALMRAAKLQSKAAKVGFDWPAPEGAIEKTGEELGEFAEEVAGGSRDAMQDEGGDLLFAAVNALRLAHVNPEIALENACRKFSERFQYIETHADRPLTEMTLKQMDALWNAAKEKENGRQCVRGGGTATQDDRLK